MLVVFEVSKRVGLVDIKNRLKNGEFRKRTKKCDNFTNS